jgi:hypothetical protein
LNTNPAPTQATPSNGTSTAVPGPSTLMSELLEKPRYERALEPQNFDEGWKVAEMVSKLRLCGVMSPEDAYARILTGRAVGLPAMASIQGIALVENKSNGSWTPCMYAKTKVAIALSRPDVIEYFRPVELTDKKATWIAKRKAPGSAEQAYSFEWDDAVRAGLVGRGRDDAAKASNNYDKHPRSMLQWRAAGRLADIICADLLNGLSTREDIEDEAERVAEEEAGRAVASAAVLANVPARDWAKEGADIRASLQAAAKSADKAAARAARDEFKKFQLEAPKEHAEALKVFYNDLVAAPGAKPAAPVAAPVPTMLAAQPSTSPATSEPTPPFGGP